MSCVCVLSGSKVVKDIGVAGSFSEGGQPFCPAKIQTRPAKIFSCQGGPSSLILFCHAKLLCQTVLPNCSANGQTLQVNGCKTVKNCRKTGKYGRNQPKVAENRQKLQKTLENVEFCRTEMRTW